MTAGECSLFGGFTQFQQETVIFTVVLHKLHTDVLQMCTQMLVTGEYTDVVHVCRCVWSHLGLTRSRDHGKGDACLKSKMATGKVTSFQVLCHKYSQLLPEYAKSVSNKVF